MSSVMKYADLAALYESLESTPKRLEKTAILAKVLKEIPKEELRQVMYLVQGTVFPPWSSQKVGIAERLVIKAMQLSFGETEQAIENLWRESGDLGDVALTISSKKKQATLFSEHLTIKKVFDNIEKCAAFEGSGTVDRKIQLMAELLTSASESEARYLVRTFLGQLRAGLGEGTIRDAIGWAFLIQVPFNPEKGVIDFKEDDRTVYDSVIERVQAAMDITCDSAEVALLVKENGIEGLHRVSLLPGRPVRVMLFQKASGLADAFSIVGKPAFIEFKYDGFRMQIHKIKDGVKIFTRRLEEVTSQFPDVAAVIAKNVAADSFILDAEAVGIDLKSRHYLPFQHISQRIKRKYGIDDMAAKFPVEIRVFDLLFLNGESLLGQSYQCRRKAIENLVPNIPGCIAPANAIFTENEHEAEGFYQAGLKEGMEGVMAKCAGSPYQPGSRVGFGVKVKPVMDTLDLVIVRSEWGEGKRAGWLTSFTLACRDKDGNFLEIGNVGTGFKEKPEEGTAFSDMTNLLKPLILEEQGREVIVKPQVVMEIKFEEIQQSPTYGSGFALRFPRLVQIREDKPPDEVSTIEDVKRLFLQQR